MTKKCRTKTIYYTKREAERKLDWILTEGEVRRDMPNRVYQCDICNGWHLTHMPVEKYMADRNINQKLKYKEEWKKLMR